jgi:hypothetical protein
MIFVKKTTFLLKILIKDNLHFKQYLCLKDMPHPHDTLDRGILRLFLKPLDLNSGKVEKKEKKKLKTR